MVKISLIGLEFFAHHGVYADEQKNGNHFEVDIAVEAVPGKGIMEDKLHATVNYEKIYEVIAKEMEHPSKLLEHVAERIIERTFEAFSEVYEVQVSVAKRNPPIGGKCTKAKVTINRSRRP